MRIEIQEARSVDVKDVIKRSPFKDESWAPQRLRSCYLRSVEAWTGSIDGTVACVWGLIAPTILSDKAYLWLITTDLVDEHPFVFVRHSQMVVKEMLKQFPCIVGHVNMNDPRSVKWLKWLGVTICGREGDVANFELRAG